jgi:hypothetical protein
MALSILYLLLPLGARAESPRLLWLDEAHSSAAFVGQELLFQEGSASPALTPVDRERLALWAAEHQRAVAKGIVDECRARPALSAAGSASNAASLDALVRRVPLAFVGTVTAVEAGYSPWYGEVSRLISLRVEQVVSARKSQLKPGETVAFVAVGGTISYAGSMACSPLVTGFHQPRPGDRLLILGGRSEDEPELVSATFIFPVDGSKVKPQPYRALKTTGDTAIETLLSTSAHEEDQR